MLMVIVSDLNNSKPKKNGLIADRNWRGEMVHRIQTEKEYKKLIQNVDFAKENIRLVKKYMETNDINDLVAILKLNEGLVLKAVEGSKDMLICMDTDDLYNEAMLGLIKAVEHYDTESGNAFSTYARYWILNNVRRSIKKNNRIIRIPDYVIDRIYPVSEYMKTHNCEIETACKELGVNEQEMKEYFYRTQNTVSYNMRLREEGEDGEEMLDLFYDENDISGEAKILSDETKEAVKQAVGQLKPKEQYVIVNYFGLYDNEPCTCTKIAENLNLSRERVRKIRDNALKKLGSMACLRIYKTDLPQISQ